MVSAAGSVVVAALESLEISPDEERFFSRGHAAGVTLFRRNIPHDYRDTKKLVQRLQGIRPSGAPPFIIAIDQEGGRVARLQPPFPNEGPALYLAGGRTDSTSIEHLEHYGFTVGQSLIQLGININFAPVLDILTEPANEAIGDRVFGLDAGVVTSRAAAFLIGMERSGVRGCLKHFPGQGHAKVDTHLGSARIDLSRDDLFSRELIPFEKLVPKCSMVMVAHCVYPKLDSVEASRSHIIINDLLKRDLGFGGVVVSDDMNMGALPQEMAAWTDVLIHSISAGVDMLLVCRHLDRCIAAYEALDREATRSKSFAARLEDAARKVTALRSRLQFT